MSEIKKGDWVRLTIEGEVDEVVYFGSYISTPKVKIGKYMYSLDERYTVEKTEPPMVTFKPGDRVRSKRTGNEFTIGHGGYFSHQRHFWNGRVATFTSKVFELVDVR